MELQRIQIEESNTIEKEKENLRIYISRFTIKLLKPSLWCGHNKMNKQISGTKDIPKIALHNYNQDF